MLLPELWRTVSLSDIAKFAYGKSLTSSNRISSGRIPVYGSSGLVGTHSEQMHPGPTIIIGRKGNVGAVFYVPGPFWCIDTAFYLLGYEKKLINIEYIASFLSRAGLARKAAYSAIPGLALKDVQTLISPLPPVLEQQEIVSMLQLMAAVQSKRSKAYEKLKSLRHRLFAETFLEHKDHKDWPVLTIGEVGEVQLGRQRSPEHQSGRYSKPYLRVANVFEDRIDVGDVLEMDFDAREVQRYRLRFGDILLNEGQSTELIGRPAMWRDELPECYYQNHLIRFRVSEDYIWSGEREKHLDKMYILPEYALGLFLNYFKRGVFSSLSTKTSSIATLGSKRFAALQFLVPPIELQIEYVEQVKLLRQIQARLDQQNRMLDQVTTAITSMAFTGGLTQHWRSLHVDELRLQAAERDAYLLPTQPVEYPQVETSAESDSVKFQLSTRQLATPKGRAKVAIEIDQQWGESPGDNFLFDLRELWQDYDNIADNFINGASQSEETSPVEWRLRDLALRVVDLRAGTEQQTDDSAPLLQQALARFAAAIGSHTTNSTTNLYDPQQVSALQEMSERMNSLESVLHLSSESPHHPRSSFWREISRTSPLRSIYNAFRVSGGYHIPKTLGAVLFELGEPWAEHYIARALEVLQSAGLISRFTLNVPDQSRPGRALGLDVYCLPSASNAAADFPRSVSTGSLSPEENQRQAGGRR